MKKLSVLVTFCNQKEYIRTNLDSILNQKVNFEYEILICLDGKCLESENIIDEYISKYSFIKLVKVDNSNLDTINIVKASKNRLKLLSIAQGEYFCFIDGDDFYNNEYRFQKLVNFLDKNSQYIGVFHDFCTYDNKEKVIKDIYKYCDEESSLDTEQYLRNKLHISFCTYIFRNIFYGKIPDDLNQNAINDSSFIYYMMRYGKTYHIPGVMFAYRIGINSIFNNKPDKIQNLYSLLYAEINQSILPAYKKYICKKNKHLLRICFKNFVKSQFEMTDEISRILEFAKENNCYFIKSILNWSDLKNLDRLKFKINAFLFRKFGKYPVRDKIVKVFYYDEILNFGDELNIYIIQRLFKSHCVSTRLKKADFVGIGSILEYVLDRRKLFSPPLKVFSTGFIFDEKGFHQKIKTRFLKINWLAVRGKLTAERIEKYFHKSMKNIILGDAGLLCSELVDNNFEKKYEVGIILHHVDMDNEFIKNIKIENCKFIDVTQNPIKTLKEISECKFILSSAMHGLIASDALNIPNKWIQLSDKIQGNNYKYKDYYSVYDIETPRPVDLRFSEITIDDIKKYKTEYNKEDRYIKVKIIQDRLVNCIKQYDKL